MRCSNSETPFSTQGKYTEEGGVALGVLQRLTVLVLALSGVACASGVPPVPQGMDVREVMSRIPPAALVAHLAERPDEIPHTFRRFGDALMTDDAALRTNVERYLSAFTREHAKRERDVRVLVSLQVVDPNRFLGDAEFRARVVPMLPRALDAQTPRDIRVACLRELNGPIGLSFDESEKIALAWGVVPRNSGERRIAFGSDIRMPDDLSGPIETSIFSINSDFFTADEAKAFFSALRAAAPKRKIVVLADEPIRDALADVAAIETFSRSYTPWPRDPFTIGRTSDDAIVFVNRPNLQPDREEDANMVRALVQAAPFKATWTVAPVSFHNGHVLLTPDAAWISIHTLEIRTLDILGLERVPTETFGMTEGIERYISAVRRAAKELEELYRRPVKFVHPLDADPELFGRLGGGGGIDLDSVVTLLPKVDGTLSALVGDVALGATIARTADWSAARAAYGFATDAAKLGVRIADAQAAPRTRALGNFLDVVAGSLTARGIAVQRVPLLSVPHAMVGDGLTRDFLLTWNNVTLEKNGKDLRAEGFASLVAAGDDYARNAFAAAGYELELYPPLVRSVILSGGYRCASNHIRP